MNEEDKGVIVPIREKQLNTNTVCLYEELKAVIRNHIHPLCRSIRQHIEHDYAEAKGSYNKNKVLYEIENMSNEVEDICLRTLGKLYDDSHTKHFLGENIFHYESEAKQLAEIDVENGDDTQS